jgi:cytoskeletal protein CcmA (bactofilin family)
LEGIEMLKGDKGSVLLITVLVVLALATVLTAASFLFVGGIQEARLNVASAQAHYLAEAGIEYAIEQLVHNWNWSPPTGPISFPPNSASLGTFKISISSNSQTERTIQSTGTVTTGRKSVERTVTVDVQRAGFPLIFNNALASSTDIDLTGNSRVYSSNERKAKGNVYGHKRISLKGNVEITGSVSSALENGVTIKGNVEVGEGIFAGPQYFQEIPTVEEHLRQSWEDKAKTGTIYSSGLSYSGNVSVNLGNAYINGDLTITGNASISLADDAIVYVKGKVKITGNASIRGQGIVVAEGVIDVTGNMSHQLDQPASIAFVSLSSDESKITGNGEVAGVFFVPWGALKIAGNSYIFGAAVAYRIDFAGNAEIKYNADLMDSNVTWDPLRVLRVNKWYET